MNTADVWAWIIAVKPLALLGFRGLTGAGRGFILNLKNRRRGESAHPSTRTKDAAS